MKPRIFMARFFLNTTEKNNGKGRNKWTYNSVFGDCLDILVASVSKEAFEQIQLD